MNVDEIIKKEFLKYVNDEKENTFREDIIFLEKLYQICEHNKEDKKVKKVRCIENLRGQQLLTINKEYDVIKTTVKAGATYYSIIDDKEGKGWYARILFEEVEEKKEYTVMELFEEKEGKEYKIQGLENLYKVENGILRRSVDKGYYETMYCDKTILKAKFTKVEEPKPISFLEAWKAYEEGKTIESIYTHRLYKKDKGETCLIKTVNTYEFRPSEFVEIREIENEWIIE